MALIRLAVALVVSLSLVACSTLKVIADGQEASKAATQGSSPVIEQKDLLVLSMTDGRRLELRVSSVNAEHITGVVSGQVEPVRVPVHEVQRVERLEPDTRAILLTIGIVLLVGLIAANSIKNDIVDKLTPKP